jgi:ketosteroid isomerase-like protein
MEGAEQLAVSDPGAAVDRDAAIAWVEMFTEGWRQPTDADSFCDHFDPWMDPEVRLIQPQLPPVVGRRAFREKFARPLFELVPDLRGTVEGWAARGEMIYIELRLEGTVGRRRFQMRTCDRITLRDGKAVERIAYLDATPLLTAVLRSPRSWPRFVRMRLRSRRRAAT